MQRKFLCGQPDTGRAQDPAVLIPDRPDLDHIRHRLHGAGAQFRPAQVHKNTAGPASHAPRITYMFDRAGPCGRVVMRTIDAQATHPGLEQLMHQQVVISSFR